MSDMVTTWGNYKLQTIYKIEYIQDPQKWAIVCEGKHGAPWELYEHKEMDDLSEAIAWYCYAIFRNDIFDVKMFEETYINEEFVRERSIELPSCFVRDIHLAVNMELRSDNEELAEQHKHDEKLKADTADFLKKYNATKLFADFQKQH